MARPAQPKPGNELEVLQRPLKFSYWPLYKGIRRPGLQSNVFVTDPWTLIRNSISKHCPPLARDEAIAFVTQAEQFFVSAQAATVLASKPLLTYYSFMNLAKAYILTQGVRSTIGRAQHGLSEQLTPGGKEILDGYLQAYPSNPTKRP